MKKIVFNVEPREDLSFSTLAKEIDNISCKISIDLKNNVVTAEDIDNSAIDTVIGLISRHYTIFSVDIDNSEENTDVTPQPKEEPVTTFTLKNEYVNNKLNNLAKSAHWAMLKKNAPERNIGEFIGTCTAEISMTYSSSNPIEFAIGDIIDVNFGVHIPGETSGGHVTSIVCNITADGTMAFVVPVFRVSDTSDSYLPISVPKDTVDININSKNLTCVLDKGKYVRRERINSLIGHTTPEFFTMLLRKLASTFDFTNKTEVSLASTATEKTTEKSVLAKIIGPSLDKVNPANSPSKEARRFLDEIGMPKSQLVTKSFAVACHIKKVNYENIITRIHKDYPNISESTIKRNLKENFKTWLKAYPEMEKQFPKISIMALVKMFSEKFE
ncbi:MAG: hypothetical protein IJH39_10565 [Clostridia bacterium]|nr:hypothetical protein [Clostridia bacterium]